MTAIEHLKITNILKNTTYVRRNGQGFRLLDGKEIPEEEFEEMFKLPIRINIVLQNPCGKHKFLDV